ncbi:hypothetical protein SAY87_014789 [Trapa incisa]|uniref:Disease resistance R13L4/SHOC-2-like LRR domain-containing protein n=1 Tax=Trapa incisa TaxID=236973 RepID=A0AAN7GW50_9MYRT|nr:hypothetical protein SAY87_014789 [Trapa incisa]
MRIPIFMWLVSVALYSALFSDFGTLDYAQCLLSDQQQSLLLSMKKGLVFNASLSTKLVTWSQGSTSWAGVTCEGGTVTGLDLSNESISDGINSSSSIFSLQHLRRLNLGFNRFNSTTIPPRIKSLRSLEYLNLSNSGFVGQIPIEMSYLVGLTKLDLSTLYFRGSPSLKLEDPNLKMLVGRLAEMKELHLDGVNISAAGEEWCRWLSSSLPKLEVLSMSNCYLSGPISPSLLDLKSLSVIRLVNNNLSTKVPGFLANFRNLTTLHLSSAGLSGMFPSKILLAPALQNLDLSNNPLLQGSLPEFSTVSSLRTLDVRFTNFSGTLPDSIGNLSNLSRLVLANCSFSGKMPDFTAKLSQLVYLDLSTNNFSGPPPSFSHSRNLIQIIFSHNVLSGEISSTQWEYLQKLEVLDLSYNSLQGSIPSSLFALPSIQKLQLSNNQMSGQVQLMEHSNFSSYQLDTLDLSSNDLTGPVPATLFQFPELKYLSLSFNNFNGSLDINVVQKISNLSYLDLSYNNLELIANASGSGVSSFPQMTTVKLASCQPSTS